MGPEASGNRSHLNYIILAGEHDHFEVGSVTTSLIHPNSFRTDQVRDGPTLGRHSISDWTGHGTTLLVWLVVQSSLR